MPHWFHDAERTAGYVRRALEAEGVFVADLARGEVEDGDFVLYASIGEGAPMAMILCSRKPAEGYNLCVSTRAKRDEVRAELAEFVKAAHGARPLRMVS